jgi:uncharacterized protein (DUF2141 family)
MKKIVLIICLFFQFILAGEKDSSGVIILDIYNFENNEGRVRVSLFKTEDGFPNDFKKSYTYITEKIKDNKALVVLDSIPFGEYAIGILHDANMDSVLNTNWLGMPKEGVAASNNATGTFGPPSFEDAKFKLESDSLRQSIEIFNY